MDSKTTDSIALGLSQTGFFSKLILDYIEGDQRLSPFYKSAPALEAFGEAIKGKKKESINRQLLAGVLKSQYGPELLSEDLLETIESLTDPGTFTVTTGHQLNIFGGPLYFIYKIITTVNLAEAVERAHPGCRIVPVFWMATEDHDFEEINHVNIFGKQLKWDGQAGGAAGRMDPRGLASALEELKVILGSSAHAEELYSLFEKAYTSHETLAGATRYFVHRLLGKYGLLIIDGDDPELKSSFSDIMKTDILEEISSREVTETDQQLQAAGYKTQAHPREINFFYLGEGIRERIVVENGQYKVLNTSLEFSRETLGREIEEHPEKFSPNVIMRPVYQEKILPNLAYIGGGGELAYWMQLQSTFRAHGVNFPVLILRNSALLIDENGRKKADALEIDPASLFLPEQQLIDVYVKSHSTEELTLEDEKKELEELFEKISRKAISIDPTLKDSAEAEKTKILNSLKGLEHKLSKAGKRKFDTEIAQLSRLREKLFPGTGLQERHDNFIPFYLKQGPSFFDLLKDHFDPFLPEMVILFPDAKRTAPEPAPHRVSGTGQSQSN